MRAALLFCLRLQSLVLFYTTGASSEENNGMLQALLDTFEMEVNSRSPPFLDHNNYVEELARTIAKHDHILIVGGPRDVGKSAGLVFMGDAAQQVGYSIIDINLKGTASYAHVRTLMKQVSWEIVDKLMSIEDYKCVITNLLTCRAMRDKYWQTL